MGNTLPKPRIIEFNGLPGAGKTTISRLLGENIDTNQYGPIEYRYFRHEYQKSPYSLLLSPKYYKQILDVQRYSKLFNKNHALQYSLIPLHYIRMYNHFMFDKKKGLLIVDQGVVQGMLSIAHTKLFSEKENLYNIIKRTGLNNLPLIIVNCICPSEVANNRLSERENQGSRLQQMGDKTKKQALEIQFENIKILRTILVKACPNVQTIDLDTNVNPGINAKKIIDILKN